MTDNARRCIRRSPTPTPLPRTLAVQVRRAACPLTILFTVTGIGSALHAQDDVPPEAVQRLIRQLDSASLSERSAAERRLQEMGPRILPLLSEPAPSAAARDAIGRIRELLEREQAAQSVLPSRVTLKGEAPLHDVIPVIEAQTGNAIRISGLSVAQLNQTLSFHWHETPFWDCMTFLDRQPHLAVRMSPADGVLEIVPEAPEESQPLVRQTSGAFLVLVQAASLRPDFTDETRRLIRVRFDLVAEPRLRPLFVRVHDGDLLLNAPGEQFLEFNPTASRELPADRTGPVSLTADFVAAETWAGDTVALSGKVEVELAAGREEVVFRHLDSAERVIRRRGGVTVTLDRATFRAAEDRIQSVQVDVRVAYDQGGPAFDSHRTWVYHNKAFLRAAGPLEQWRPVGFETVAIAESAVKLSYRFEDVPVGVQNLEFIYEAPMLIVNVPVALNLPQIPVPPWAPDGVP